LADASPAGRVFVACGRIRAIVMRGAVISASGRSSP
jgi:hypothetical protein